LQPFVHFSNNALKRKKALLEYYHDQIRKKIRFLKIHLGQYFLETVRLQRTIKVYQQWKDILNKCNISGRCHSDLTTVMKI